MPHADVWRPSRWLTERLLWLRLMWWDILAKWHAAMADWHLGRLVALRKRMQGIGGDREPPLPL